MYKTFELLNKAICIVVFWSLIFYVLETRKINVSFIDVGLSTLLGWCLFFLVFSLFGLYISLSYRKSKQDNKELISKGVIEDGMKFTVGGHTHSIQVLPEKYYCVPQPLLEYISTLKSNEMIDVNNDHQAIQELLNNQEDILGEQEMFAKKEGAEFLELNQEGAFNKNKNEKNKKRQKDEQVVKDVTDQVEYISNEKHTSNEDMSQRIDKGVLYYQYQFNHLYSYIIYHKIHQFLTDFKENKLFVNERLMKTVEKEEKLAQLQDEANALREEIDSNIRNVLNQLPTFEYVGIVSTLPKIKTRRALDISKYQLVIFTALFPFISWKDLRSTQALNSIGEANKKTLIESLTEEQKVNFNQRDLGLSLRDKRILWNARKLFDIYNHRDKDLAEKSYSSFNMPISLDEDGNPYNPLEETVALCELLRSSMNIKTVSFDRDTNEDKESFNPLSQLNIINIVLQIFKGKNRFNSSNHDERIGFTKDGRIFIDVNAFERKFNAEFARLHPKYDNIHSFNEALHTFYSFLNEKNLLDMRIKSSNEQSKKETYDHYTKGQLFNMTWQFGNNKNKTINNMLIIHCANIFQSYASINETVAGYLINYVSPDYAIPHSEYSDNLIKNGEEIKKALKKRQHEEAMHQKEMEEQEKLNQSMMTEIDVNEVEVHNPINDTIQEAVKEQSQTVSTSTEKLVSNQAKDQDKGILVLDDGDDDIVNSIVNGEGKELNQTLARFNENDESSDMYLNAREVLYQKHQVLRLTPSDKQADEVRREYAILKGKNKTLNFLQYKRSELAVYENEIELTIVKILHDIKQGQLNRGKLKLKQKNGRVLIHAREIPFILNVFEQIAIYKRGSNKGVWTIQKSTAKNVNNHSDSGQITGGFDEISVIEFLDISPSNEDEFYQTLQADVWDKEKASRLFKSIFVELMRIKPMFKQLQIINGVTHNNKLTFIIPKYNLGNLYRASVDINSFLSYTTRYKNRLPSELIRFANALTSYEKDGITYVKFEMIEDTKNV